MTFALPDIPLHVYLMLFAPIGLIVFAAVWKWFEVRAAREWSSALGTVVESSEQLRMVKLLEPQSERSPGYRFEERSFANIVYEYEVAGQTYSNNRVTIGEDRGNYEVAETIARYPVGKHVTVYYNPYRYAEAVLERELPGLWRGVAWVAAITVALILGAIIGFSQLSRFASAHVAHAPLTVAIGALGALLALVALGIQRQARRARDWPVVKGVIRTSGLERFRSANDDGPRRPIRFSARIAYTYRFGGKDYNSTVASMTGEVQSTSDRAVQRWVKRYHDGQSVDVYVNPEKPSESALEPRARGIWVVWVIAAVLFVMAAFVATRG